MLIYKTLILYLNLKKNLLKNFIKSFIYYLINKNHLITEI